METTGMDPTADTPNRLLRRYNFNWLVADVIQNFGNDNNPDEAAERSTYQNLTTVPGTSYIDADGRMYFGDEWQTHHVTISNGRDYEVAYATRQNEKGWPVSVVVADCFEDGSLARRLVFKQGSKGSITENIDINQVFNTSSTRMSGSQRTLDKSEKAMWLEAFADPYRNASAMHVLMDSGDLDYEPVLYAAERLGLQPRQIAQELGVIAVAERNGGKKLGYAILNES
jgi:hypothetical protein